MGQSTTRSPSYRARAAQLAKETAVLLRAGVLAPGTPGQIAGQLGQLRQYGPTLAGSYGAAARRVPNRVAVQDETNSRTFAQLDARATAIARGLGAHGIGPQDTLAILGRNSVAFVEALVATSRVGADALLLSTFLSAPQTREVMLRERPKVIFVDMELLPLLEQAPEDVLVVTLRPHNGRRGFLSLDELAASSGPNPDPGGRRGRLIVLTSGTTGTPKGARRPAPTSLSPAASMLSRLRLHTSDTIMVSSPLFHTWALGVLQIAGALAATVVLRQRADPEVVLAAVEEAGCTAVTAVPVILERILQLPPGARARYRTEKLRVVASSGSALTKDVATRFQDVFGEVLYNVYGSTEISWAAIATPEDLRAAAGTAGKAPLGTRLMVLDDNGNPVPQGETGRIFVGNDLLFEGYTGGTSREQWDGLMSTGDKGYLDHEGRLMVVGREDDLVISGAEKIYPLEVEEVILSLPGVREVAVVGRPDEEMGQRLVAYVVCEDGIQLTAGQVQDHVRRRLARFAVPKEVGFLSRLPRTPTGKVVPRLLPNGAVPTQ
ncbi:MAG TPA: AMP-binding protein [Kineosporiaceae bacterium]|nr:AMP-binding protein [Kineosporiaceae bacterium]